MVLRRAAPVPRRVGPAGDLGRRIGGVGTGRFDRGRTASPGPPVSGSGPLNGLMPPPERAASGSALRRGSSSSDQVTTAR
ncbi:MAG: hypothetical protein QOI68_3582 [Pseudonocardiales bacterium]|nr:hypothetical protein [Pseudonocardiales bacterium]